MNRWSFVVVAGGAGKRLGGIPKQFRSLGGRPVWRWSVDLGFELWKKGFICEVILVVPSDWRPELQRALRCVPDELPVSVVAGGPERALSVLAGVRSAQGERVMIHDGARPFLREELCEKLMEATSDERGAIPVLPVADAVKRLKGDSVIPEKRDSLRLTQTPQCFPRSLLIRCLENSSSKSRDEAEAWIAEGRKVNLVEGDRWNFKITDPGDWKVAQAMAREMAGVEIRTGMGFDVHPLVPGRKLILGGVEITDAPLGLEGHSDADVVAHALCDAILGAAGEPDIGLLFPASVPKYKGISSLLLLDLVVKRVRAAGWRLNWADVTLHAQVPRLAGFIPEIVHSINNVLVKTPDDLKVNLKVKSGEGVGEVGAAFAMQCYAVATLQKCCS